MRRERLARILYLALLAAAVTGALGCEKIEKIGEAGDSIRRSTERNWEQARRRIGGLADTGLGERP